MPLSQPSKWNRLLADLDLRTLDVDTLPLWIAPAKRSKEANEPRRSVRGNAARRRHQTDRNEIRI